MHSKADDSVGRDHIIGRHICNVNWIISERGDWIQVTHVRVKWQHFVNMIMILRVPQKQWIDSYLWIFKEDLHHQDWRNPKKEAPNSSKTPLFMYWHDIISQTEMVCPACQGHRWTQHDWWYWIGKLRSNNSRLLIQQLRGSDKGYFWMVANERAWTVRWGNFQNSGID